MYSTEPLPHFVDDYLAYLHEIHPTGATFDGVHFHDDLLEDLGRSSIDLQVRELGGFARRLEGIDPTTLTADEQLERRMVQSNIQGRLVELEEVRAWERNPQYYADIIAASLASQAIFSYAPAPERARRIVSKLRQVPRMLESARLNIKEPPGIFAKVGIETLEGVLAFIERDLPLAFRDVDDLHVLGDLADTCADASRAVGEYVTYLRDTVAPKSRGSFRLGRALFERKLATEDGLAISADRLLAIAERELRAAQEEFRRVAARQNGADSLETWRRLKRAHPALGQLVPTVREQLGELAAFLERHRIISVPGGEDVIVAPTPQFYRWTFASLWAPGPFEVRSIPAYYYVTDADPDWPAERQEEHLRDFNYATLWSISMHEVFPGHLLYYQHIRRLPSKLRKSTMFAPMSFIEGWAHYCEQMMLDAGFKRGDNAVRLGQLAEALIRLVRTIVGIRLHTEDLSVEQGVRLFRDEALLEEASARREAERGTFDPGYVLYALGKLMLLKLRADFEASAPDRFNVREFHDRLLRNGSVPFWMQRQLFLGAGNTQLLD